MWPSPRTARRGKDVVIVGGGDTGTDCLGTAHRQQARSVTHVDSRPRPPERRTQDMPWQTYPAVYRSSAAHEEDGTRLFSVDTIESLDDGQGRLRAIHVADRFRDDHQQFHRAGVVRLLPAQLALIAWVPRARTRPAACRVGRGARRAWHGGPRRAVLTSVKGVFAAGDIGRASSWWSGRSPTAGPPRPASDGGDRARMRSAPPRQRGSRSGFIRPRRPGLRPRPALPPAIVCHQAGAWHLCSRPPSAP